MMSEPSIPLALKSPRDVLPETAPYWEAAKEGRLLLRHCRACDKAHYYPRHLCPFCLSDAVDWREAQGGGAIYSYTIIAGGPAKATIPAFITLDEGVTVDAGIVLADASSVSIGDRVCVTFVPGPFGQPVLSAHPDTKEARNALAAQAHLAAALTRNNRRRQADHALTNVAIVGAGVMGGGIALACASAGLKVTLIDQGAERLDRALAGIDDTLARSVAKRRIDQKQAQHRRSLISTSTDIAHVGDADVVVEAVWEQLALKQELFQKIEHYAREDALLGTNTSSLDVDAIAGATGRASNVIGLHFFSPAHIMTLTEVVRGRATSEDAIARAVRFGRLLGKTPVVVGNCFGFVGNRLMAAREKEATLLVLEGAAIEDVDRVQVQFGFPMGSFALQDMSGGIELMWRMRQANGESEPLGDRLGELGRFGQKTKKGYYDYGDDGRTPIVSAQVTGIIEQIAREKGAARRAIGDAEILERLLLPMINEGARLLEEGIAEQAGDIDLIWSLGYAWPKSKGGPMFYADTLGLGHVVERLRRLEAEHGDSFAPARLLLELNESGRSFCEV